MSKLVNPFSGKPIVALDFDAVLHRYKGWNGGKLDRPMDGASEFVEKLQLRGFRVVIHSTRDEEQIRGWLKQWGFPDLEICSEKPPAVVLLDDRCVCFDGRFTNLLLDQVTRFRPYWEQDPKEI
jgi:hypothetical protein